MREGNGSKRRSILLFLFFLCLMLLFTAGKVLGCLVGSLPSTRRTDAVPAALAPAAADDEFRRILVLLVSPPH